MKWHLAFLRKNIEYFLEIEVVEDSCTVRHGKGGTLGATETIKFTSSEESLQFAKRNVKEKQDEGYSIRAKNLILKDDLPDDLKTRLSERKRLDVVSDKIELLHPDEIKVISVVARYEEVDDPSNTPNKTKKGLFLATAYTLIESIRVDNKNQIFIWLPIIGRYGLWDTDNYLIHVFTETTWKDVEAAIQKYLQGQRISLLYLPSVIPMRHYFAFIPAAMPDEMDQILHIPAQDERQSRSLEFVDINERLLLPHPFTVHLEACFIGLAKLYQYLGQSFESQTKYAEAAKWFEKTLLIASQSPRLRKELLSEVLLQLSFCYMEVASFEQSLNKLDEYQVFETTTADVCEKIRRSILNVQQLYNNIGRTYEMEIGSHKISDYEKAISITYNKLNETPTDPDLHYTLACWLAVTKKEQEAVYHLEKAIQYGFSNKTKITVDAHFKNIRSSSNFNELMIKYF